MSPADLDKARAQRDSALAEQDGARQQLDKLARGVRREDIDEAQAALLAATAEVALAERELADLSIVATRSGRLDSLPYHLGERVAVGAVLAAIQADEAPYARVYVPEPSLAGYRVSQPVRVQVDGVAEPFTGLRWISKEPAFTPTTLSTSRTGPGWSIWPDRSAGGGAGSAERPAAAGRTRRGERAMSELAIRALG